MAESEVKGLAFLNVLGAIVEVLGASARDEVIRAMPVDGREALTLGSLIASGWYPVRWYRDLLGAAVAVSKDASLPRELGKVSVRRDVTGVRRLLFRVVSVEILTSQAARFFKAYFRPGDVSVVRVDAHTARVAFHHCYGFNEHVWQEQAGGVDGLLEASHVEAPRVRVLAGGNDGDAHMTLESRWR